MTEPRPVSPAEAVKRAMSMVGSKNGVYWLGTGNYRPSFVDGKLVDRPFTDIAGKDLVGTDCAGFALSWCWKLPRHRPGYNRHGAFDVEDDINSNSAIGDACGARDCFDLATGVPQPGDVLAYPTIRLAGHAQPFIGHVAIVVGVSRVSSWDAKQPRYDLLDIAQSHGPNGFSPAVVRTDGSVFWRHAVDWPKAEHTTYLLRALS